MNFFNISLVFRVSMVKFYFSSVDDLVKTNWNHSNFRHWREIFAHSFLQWRRNKIVKSGFTCFLSISWIILSALWKSIDWFSFNENNISLVFSFVTLQIFTIKSNSFSLLQYKRHRSTFSQILNKLILSENQIRDKGAKYLADALRREQSESNFLFFNTKDTDRLFHTDTYLSTSRQE